MFYSHFILAKKGPLGTIWIAAHLERKLRKAQIHDTNISLSVDSIMFPEVPIALRLSGHLLLGVVRIYSRKVGYLHSDCSDALLKIKQAFRSGGAVDLPPESTSAPYHSITMPDVFDYNDLDFLPDVRPLNGSRLSAEMNVASQEQITLQENVRDEYFLDSQIVIHPDEMFDSLALPIAEAEAEVERGIQEQRRVSLPVVLEDIQTVTIEVDEEEVRRAEAAIGADLAGMEQAMPGTEARVNQQMDIDGAEAIFVPEIEREFIPPEVLPMEEEEVPDIEHMRSAADPLNPPHEGDTLPAIAIGALPTSAEFAPPPFLSKEDLVAQVQVTPTGAAANLEPEGGLDVGITPGSLGGLLGLGSTPGSFDAISSPIPEPAPTSKAATVSGEAEQGRKRDAKKRKIVLDQSTVLSGDVMKSLLGSTSDIRRQRMKHPVMTTQSVSASLLSSTDWWNAPSVNGLPKDIVEVYQTIASIKASPRTAGVEIPTQEEAEEGAPPVGEPPSTFSVGMEPMSVSPVPGAGDAAAPAEGMDVAAMGMEYQGAEAMDVVVPGDVQTADLSPRQAGLEALGMTEELRSGSEILQDSIHLTPIPAVPEDDVQGFMPPMAEEPIMPSGPIFHEGILFPEGELNILAEHEDADMFPSEDSAMLSSTPASTQRSGRSKDGEAASGWSQRTRRVGSFLQATFKGMGTFDSDSSRVDLSISLNGTLEGKTRKEAALMFFETLVLKSRDYVDVSQEEAFGNILLFARPKLASATF